MVLVAPVFDPKSCHHPIWQAAVSVLPVHPHLDLHHMGDVVILLLHPNYSHINITIPAYIRLLNIHDR